MQIPGMKLGHVSLAQERTGASVFLFDRPARAGYRILGSAPAQRELQLCDPTDIVPAIDAIVFAGGSVFGLAATDGVVQWLREQGRGLATVAGPVPLVTGACIYDLDNGVAIGPSAEHGYQACIGALASEPRCGQIGAGCGATVGKLVTNAKTSPGGFGWCQLSGPDELWVAAAAVVNCVGDVLDEHGQVVAGACYSGGEFANSLQAITTGLMADILIERQNTTLVAVFTNADLDKAALCRLAKMACGGIARATVPAFTSYDGDCVICVSLGSEKAHEIVVGSLANEACRQAIVNAVKN